MHKFRGSLFLVSFAVLALASTALAQETSSPEDRARIVAISQKLESNPLAKDLVPEREWAIKRIIEVSDISVPVCATVLGDYFKYKYSSELTGQLTLAEAAFVIQNQDKARDKTAIYLAGAESVLKAYQAILKEKPGRNSKPLDELVAIQNDGKLGETVQKRAAEGCK